MAFSQLEDSNMTTSTDENPSEKEWRILVVGDWLVDEHWVTGIHRSSTSSRTGQAHYRALHLLDSTTQSFCAAGKTATVLYRARKGPDKSKKLCKVCGAGIWHKEDTETLSTMLEPSTLREQNLHRITRCNDNTCKTSGKGSLFNLGELLKDKDKKEHEVGTTRVIRIYQNTGSKIDLLQRIDWELPVPFDRKAWITDKELIEDSDFGKFIKEKKINAVVIKDICKGVVSDELIEWMSEKIGGTIPWFVSTKEWKATWLSKLKNTNLRLLLIPQVAARTAIREGDLGSWMTNSGFASREALLEIDNLADSFKKDPLLIVLPEHIRVLACYTDKDNKKRGLLQTDSNHPPLPIDVATASVPMASIFLSAMIGFILYSDKPGQDNNNIISDEIIRKSIEFTQKWMEAEAQRVDDPENWSPDEVPYLDVTLLGQQSDSVGKWVTIDWESEKDSWNKALSDYGIIEKNSEKYFEPWRAMTLVDEYVCCINSKRKLLQKVVEAIKVFKNDKKKHHKSCMLIDFPGSGKSYFVSCLSKALNMRYLPFNITQMLSKSDILDCFDTIVTTQSQNREEPILVFIDEINAKLQGQYAYDIFLAPLEEGVYIRAGKTFHILPCFWIFAGTEKPVAECDPNFDESTKARDFESRLTIPPIDLKTDNTKIVKEAQIEKIYCGISILRYFFPDVRKVSQKVLMTFSDMKLNLQIRDLKHFVKSFQNIQYGQVLARNIPEKLVHDFGIDLGKWLEQSEGDMVEIRN